METINSKIDSDMTEWIDYQKKINNVMENMSGISSMFSIDMPQKQTSSIIHHEGIDLVRQLGAERAIQRIVSEYMFRIAPFLDRLRILGQNRVYIKIPADSDNIYLVEGYDMATAQAQMDLESQLLEEIEKIKNIYIKKYHPIVKF